MSWQDASRRALARIGPLALATMAACSREPTASVLAPCTAASGFGVSLAVAQYLVIDPADTDGCVSFGSNGAPDTVEYVVVPQAATGTAGASAAFALAGEPVAALVASLVGEPVAQRAPERFHSFLRRAERDRTWGGAPVPSPAALRAATGAAVPPVVGDRRRFSVCATTTCSRFDSVTAIARAVGQRLAIFVDTAAPANGLDSVDLDSLKLLFDTRLYAVDTAAFGRESDVDANSVVIVLMTNVVNKLVTSQQCQNEGFVAGFFFGADIDPRFAGDPRMNHGEVFYSLVADPAGQLSCQHARDQVKRIVPVTFVHELQHMISYNQHVLVRDSIPEELWLNEGLSHYAEEIAGRSFLPGDAASFSRFVTGDLFNAYAYLDATGSHFMLASEGIGSLAERGAVWLFVRYLVDRFATDTARAAQNVFTRSLVRTPQVGAVNVQRGTGEAFSLTVARWGLANWVSDLPSFAAPAELAYRSWQFRTTYESLNQQLPSFFPKPFPLVPTASRGDSVSLSGTLRAGSGVYHRVLHAPGRPPFTLLFSNGSRLPVSATVVPRLSVIRIR